MVPYNRIYTALPIYLRRYAPALLLLFFLPTLFAQNYIADYNIIGYEDGMVGMHPHQSMVSQDGLLYILTGEALNSYDGHRFRTYPLPPAPSIDEPRYRILEEDKEGAIWYGWTKYSNFSTPFSQLSLNISILDVKSGKTASLDHYFKDLPFESSCIRSIDKPVKQSTLYISTCDGRVYAYTRDQFEFLFQTPDQVPITSVLPSQKQFWIAESGFLSLVDKQGEYIKRIAINGSVSKLSWLTSDLMDVAFPYKIRYKGKATQRLIWDKQQQKLSTFISFGERPIDVSQTYSIAYDQAYRLWHLIYADDWQVCDQDGKLVFKLLDNFPALKDEYFADRGFTLQRGPDGALYAPLFSQVLCLNAKPSPFSILLKNQQLSLRDIAPGRDDTIWISTYQGLYGYDRVANRTFLHSARDDVPWLQAVQKEDGTLWATCNQEYVLMYNSSGEVESHIPIRGTSEPENLKGSLTLFEDSRSQQWLGMYNGIALYAPDSNAFYLHHSLNHSLGLERTAVRQFSQQDSLIWAVTDKGAYSFTLDGKAGPYRFVSASTRFNGIYWQGRDSCWLASTGKGLLLWIPKTGTQQWFTKRQHGLSSDYLYGVHADNQGRLWLPTNNGLSCFDPRNQGIEVFYEEASLFGNEFNYLSHYYAPDGSMWLGGVNGLVYFYPDSVQVQPYAHTPLHCVYLGLPNLNTGLLDDRTKAFRSNPGIELDASKRINAFRVKLSLASYLGRHNHQYFWYAEGLTDQWQLMDGNSLTLADLPYGEFTLRFRARTRNRALSSQELSIPLIVRKPYYRQAWFWLLTAGGLLLLVYMLVRWRTRQYKATQAQLEAEVQRRTQQIQQDQQTILQQKRTLEHLNLGKDKIMSIIGHELRGHLFYLSTTAEELKKALQAGDTKTALQFVENLQHATLTVGETVDNLSQWTAVRTGKYTLQKRNFELLPLLERCIRECHFFAQRKDIDLVLATHDIELQVYGDPHALLTVLQNLVRNAIKFTERNGTVTLKANQTDSTLLVQVEDDGVGMPDEVSESLFKHEIVESRMGTTGEVGTGLGLRIAKEILHLHKATIEVVSKLGEGSTLTICFPKAAVSSVTSQ